MTSLLRGRDPKDVTLGEIITKLRCSKCGRPPTSATPAKPSKGKATYGHST